MEVLPLEVATSRLQEDQASLRLHQSKEETREPTAAPPFAEDLHSTTEAFAEGGLRGWMAVAGAFLVLMNTFGYANSFGVFQSYYQLNQYRDMTPSEISWIGSTGMGIEFCFAFISGPLFDRGYFRSLMISGSVGFVVCLFMTSLCTKYWQTFLSQAVGQGIFMGFLYMPSISVLAHYFERRRSLVMGIAMAGSSVGGIVFPIMLNHLFASIGFAGGIRASGYVVIAGFVAANLLMHPKYPPVKRDASGAKSRRPSPLKLIAEPRYSLTVVGTTAICLGVFFPLAYIQVFAEKAQLPRNVSDNILAILNSASFFGRILPNFAADTMGCFTTLTLASFGVSILIFALYGATSPAAVIIFALLYGFVSGAFVSLLSPLLVSTATDVHEIGLRQGMALVVNGLAALVCSPIAGALITAGHDEFTYAIAFGGGIVALGGITMIGARHLQARLMGTWRV